MVMWIEVTESQISGIVDLRGLRITGGKYTTSATTSVGGILILNSHVAMTDCEVSSNEGVTTVSTIVARPLTFVSSSFLDCC